MLFYVVKRILQFIPLCIAISLVAFIIKIKIPGDPVARLVTPAEASASSLSGQRLYWIEKLGLNLPVFYFSVTSLHDLKSGKESRDYSITKEISHAENTFHWRKYIPVIRFHKNNQYHRWLFGDGVLSRGILRGDFGTSLATREPVKTIISRSISWSLFFALASVIIAYLISIPAGMRAALNKNSIFDKATRTATLGLYSIPVFWMATLLLMVFANADMLPLFPASGVRPPAGFPGDASWFECARMTIPYLVLPLVCYTYGSFAFTSRLMRSSMLDVMSQDYIRTAYSKGLSEKKIISRHAFRNALFPIITMTGFLLPALISGSVIIETAFSIPGMGLATYSAIQNQDFPALAAIITITGLLTASGFLLSDILYAALDPRVQFRQKFL